MRLAKESIKYKSAFFYFIYNLIFFRGQQKSISANKPRDFDNKKDDDTSRPKERLCTPHIGRNKLGTIFNERIVVSPVPFAVSTRESFSTLNTIPIRFMNEDFEISSFQGRKYQVI